MKEVLYKNRYILIAAASALVLFGVWEIVARAMNLEIALPTFSATFVQFFMLFGEVQTYINIGWTLLRCIIGFIIGFIFGVMFGILAGKYKSVGAVLSPIVAFMRAAPVAAIALVLVISLPSGVVPAVIGIMLVFPIVYQQIRTATANIDPAICDVLKEMGSGFLHSTRTVYLPLLLPNMLSCISATFGMNVKAVISAEILAYTAKSIGSAIYYAKANFLEETPRLFAWVMMAVLLSVILEWALRIIVKKNTQKISWLQVKEKNS